MISVALTPWFVFGVIIIVFAAIYLFKVRPVVSMFCGVITMVIAGVISPAESVAGLSNPSILSVVILVLITSGLRSNYNLEAFIDKFYSRANSYRKFLFLMMSKVSIMSTVLNNTPVVALMTPYIVSWGRRNKIAPSRLLIPLSYATILGGMITVIGTSTTLVLNGFLLENGLSGLKQQELVLIGAPTAIIGIIFITLISKYLLPERSDIVERFRRNQREYLVSVKVLESSSIADKTVEEADLRHLQGIYLVEIIRDDQSISPVEPTTMINRGDLLVFAGDIERIVDLIQGVSGLRLPDGSVNDSIETMDVTEAVISSNSSLIGLTIRDTEFRARYDGAVVAVHRNGEKLSGRIGDIRLLSGDVLLIMAGRKFEERVDLYKDMYIITARSDRTPKASNGSFRIFLLLATALTLFVTGAFDLFTSLLILFVLMVLLKLLGMRNIKRDLDFNMVGIMVLSLALGQALVQSGGGQLIADGIYDVAGSLGKTGILLVLMVITTILTSFVSNIGAVSIMFPIAYGLSNAMAVGDPSLYMAVTYSASCAFLTPIGYQTNMIIYGPGGYNFNDFLRIGLPFTALYIGMVYLLIGMIY